MAGALLSCGLAGVLVSCGLAGDDSREDCFWYGDTWVPFREIWGSADTCQQQNLCSDIHMDICPSAVTAHEAQSSSSQLAAASTKRLLLSYSFPWRCTAASRKSAAAGSQQHQPMELYQACVSRPVLGFADGWPEGVQFLSSTVSLQSRLCTDSPSICAEDRIKVWIDDYHSQVTDRRRP